MLPSDGDRWGMGEAVYLTSVPRNEGQSVGQIRDVRFENITAVSEGGIFIAGMELDGRSLRPWL